ncbi:hypothetical protein [Aquirufa ecclesiirivi]|uniref:hypothetical protein n=1 Tax=Aquirufa ecclesiirivi TaxID=2715124 RepID=UPI003BB07458
MESVEKRPFRELYYCDLNTFLGIPENGKDLNSEPEPYIQILFKCIQRSDKFEFNREPISWSLKGKVPTKEENGNLKLSDEDEKQLAESKHDYIMFCLNRANVTDFKPLNIDEYFSKPEPENPEN